MANAITYISHSPSPPTITFAFHTTRWEYSLPSPLALDKILYLTRHVSAAKAVVLAKRLATSEARQ